jgi:pimeloyl-ACP methyl ester carboxylesterase
MTKTIRWLKITAAVYLLVGMSIYFLQDFFLFRPQVVDPNHHYNFSTAYEELNIKHDDQTITNVIMFRQTGLIEKGVVLYFHGNKRNVERYASAVPRFTDHGYEVWMLDYPGFGKSTGQLTEQGLYDEADRLYTIARGHFSADQIYIYGKSLGTGIAAHLASRHTHKMLILETPYYNLPSLISYYLPVYPTELLIKYDFPTHKFLTDVKTPIIIFQGTDDWVVPYKNAKRLEPLLKPGDRFITIPGGKHSNLRKHPVFINVVDSILSK